MTNTKEDPRYSFHGNLIEPLRRSIVRAEHWEDLFDSKEAEMADFVENLVGGARAEYEGNNSLKEYRIQPHPEGDIHILERTGDGRDSATFQKLTANGNVVMAFNHGDKSSSSIITPNAGNIAHNFTARNTTTPDMDVLKQLPEEELKAVIGMEAWSLEFYIGGKPATQGWEETMLYNDQVPHRIGHRIFPDFALEAQARLMEAYPSLFQQ